MKYNMDQSARKMVVITDPHIKEDHNYKVFAKGNEITNRMNENGNFVNIWVQDSSEK